MNSEFHSQELDKVASALAKAQGAMKPAAKDAQNPHLRSSYASLASVREAIREPFAENGLSVTQLIFGDKLVTILMHESGQWLRSEIAIETQEQKGLNSLQVIGNTLTYLRRYALSAIAGVSVADEDDDGQTGGDVKIKQQPTNGRKAETAKGRGVLSPEKLKEVIEKKAAKAGYIDKDTGELLPAKLHDFGSKTANLVSAKFTDALDGDTDAYHTALWYLCDVESANDLTAAQADALLDWLLNGNKSKKFQAVVHDPAPEEARAVVEAATALLEEPEATPEAS